MNKRPKGRGKNAKAASTKRAERVKAEVVRLYKRAPGNLLKARRIADRGGTS